MSFLDKGQNKPQLKFFPTFLLFLLARSPSSHAFSFFLLLLPFFYRLRNFPHLLVFRPTFRLIVHFRFELEKRKRERERGELPIVSEEDSSILFSCRFALRTEFIYFNKPFFAFFFISYPLFEENWLGSSSSSSSSPLFCNICLCTERGNANFLDRDTLTVVELNFP